MNNKVLKINVKIELLFLFTLHEVMGSFPNAKFVFTRASNVVMIKLPLVGEGLHLYSFGVTPCLPLLLYPGLLDIYFHTDLSRSNFKVKQRFN